MRWDSCDPAGSFVGPVLQQFRLPNFVCRPAMNPAFIGRCDGGHDEPTESDDKKQQADHRRQGGLAVKHDGQHLAYVVILIVGSASV